MRLTLSIPSLPKATIFPVASLPKSVPVRTLDTMRAWAGDGQNAGAGQGLGIQHFERSG